MSPWDPACSIYVIYQFELRILIENQIQKIENKISEIENQIREIQNQMKR